jgi:hypothetical protein
MYKSDFFTTNSAELRSGHVIVHQSLDFAICVSFASFHARESGYPAPPARLAALGRPEHIRNGQHLDGQPSLVTNCGRITGKLEAIFRSACEVWISVTWHSSQP